MAGKGLVADAAGNIYCTVGNETFDVFRGGTGYGMCFLKLSTPHLGVLDWFAPFDQQANSDADLDLGNSGPLLLPGTHRLFGGGTKFGSVFLLDSNHLGHFTPGGPDHVVLRFDHLMPDDSVGQNAVCWDAGATKYVYLWAGGANLQQFRYDTATGRFNPGGVYQQTSGSTGGGSLGVTANGSSNGILWAAGNDNVVRAFDASNVAGPQLWNSAQNAARDSLPSVGHFQFPTIVNGRAYVPTGSSQVVVYGLLPGGRGSLTGSADGSTVARSLTAEGTSDWIHWGDNNLNRKASGNRQISNCSIIGTASALTYSGDPRPLTWSDGTPTLSGNNTNGLSVSRTGNGFSLTAPADTTSRRFIVHVGGTNSGGTLTARLTNGSATGYTNTTPTVAGRYDRNYTLVYRADSPGQTLRVTWVMSSGNGEVTLSGAALTRPASRAAAQRHLVLTAFSAAPSVVPRGGSLTFSYTIRNRGTLTERGVSFRVTENGQVAGATPSPGSLAPGAVVSGSMSINLLAGLTPGTHLFTGAVIAPAGEEATGGDAGDSNDADSRQTVQVMVE